jgi:hypothetical protein
MTPMFAASPTIYVRVVSHASHSLIGNIISPTVRPYGVRNASARFGKRETWQGSSDCTAGYSRRLMLSWQSWPPPSLTWKGGAPMGVLDRARAAAAESSAQSKQKRRTKSNTDENRDAKRVSQADKLVLLTLGMEFFHSPGADSTAYVSFVYDGHRQTWPVNSSGFKELLARLFFDAHEKAPSAQAIADAVAVLAGRAKFAGPTYPVAVRLAEHDGTIYLDLCDETWQAVAINADGWNVVTDPPVRFIRRRGMQALPTPELGGTVDMLRPLLNLAEQDLWILFVAWIVAAFRPGRPFPVLSVSGEQGSAKSTLCRMARRMIDPNVADLRRLPKDERDLMIAAGNAWVASFENLSGLPGSMSDALCAVATGGGFATRLLFHDDEEKIFDAKRPILLNGIEDVPARSDLIDRSIMLGLPAIDDDKRRPESEIWTEFDRIQPLALGAILDAVAVGIRNLPTTRLNSTPRMADFALWIVAAEPVLPWRAGDFLAAYNRNRSQSNTLALESVTIAPALTDFLSGRNNWTGTVKELLAELDRVADDATRKNRGWPTNPKALGGQLRRLAPNLRRIGLYITIGDRTSKGTPVTIARKTPDQCSQSSPCTLPAEIMGNSGHSGDEHSTAAGTNVHRSTHDVHSQSRDSHGKTSAGERGEHREAKSGTFLNGVKDWTSPDATAADVAFMDANM